jgi:hypothetical protein
MANVWQNTDWLSMEFLRSLSNQTETLKHFYTGYNQEFTQPFAVGSTVRKPFPVRWQVTEGLAFQPQGVDQRETVLSIDKNPGIHFEINILERALQVGRSQDWIRKNLIDPAMAQLANHIDRDAILYATKRVNNTVGALGTNSATLDPYMEARAILDENAAPMTDRAAFITPRMQVSATKAGQQLFNPSNEISKQYRKGYMGEFNNTTFYSSNNLESQTAGVRTGAVTVAGAGQSGSSLLVNCTNGDTFLEGEPFTVDAMFNVNPISRQTTGVLKQMVITANTTASGSTVTLPIAAYGPANGIEGPGSSYQNVNALPDNLAALTFWPGTTSPNGKSGKVGLVLAPEAFAFAAVPLEQPKAVEDSFYMRDPETGLAILYVKAYDYNLARMTHRLQTLYGFGTLYVDNSAVRVASLT